MRKTLFLGAAVMLLVACGGKSIKEFTPTEQDKQTAVTVVNDTKGLQALKTNAKDSSALGAFAKIQSGANSLIGSAQASKGLTLDSVRSAIDESCITQSGGTVTYNNCSDGSQTINGTISIVGDVYSIDLTIGFAGGGYSGDVTYAGSITATDSLVNGHLSFDYDYSSVTYSVDVTYSNLTLGAACLLGPLGGSLEVDSSTKVSGYGGLGSTSFTFRADYGPACGDVKMFGG
jgi:hypothetical protein